MEVNVDLKDKHHAELTFTGEDISMLNMIKKLLIDDSDVDFIGVIQPHPELPEIKMIIKVKKGNPVSMVEKAAQKVAKMANEAKKKVK